MDVRTIVALLRERERERGASFRDSRDLFGSAGIIKEASRAVCDMMAIVLLPFFLSLCMVIFIGYAFIVCVYIVSARRAESEASRFLEREKEKTQIISLSRPQAGEKSEVTSDSFGSLELPYKTYEIKDQQFYALWCVSTTRLRLVYVRCLRVGGD